MTKFLARIQRSRVCCHPLDHEGMCLPSSTQSPDPSLSSELGCPDFEGTKFQVYLGVGLYQDYTPHNYPVPTSLIKTDWLKKHCQPCQRQRTYGAEPFVWEFCPSCISLLAARIYLQQASHTRGGFCLRPKERQNKLDLCLLSLIFNYLWSSTSWHADYQSDSFPQTVCKSIR